ncbi:MAG: hypothetical protein ACRDNA_02050 [Gaiellaceae bacterium]
MRRILTWLLLGAVVALGAAASFDALRGGEPTRAEPLPTTSARAESTAGPASPEAALAAALREAGIGGILEYADEDCDTHAVSLPDLTARPSGVGGACTFAVTANATTGYAVECSGGRVSIDDPQQAPYAQVRAECPPAWKPDGTPTLLRDGEVVEPHPCPDRGIIPMRCSRVLLSGDDLVRELRGAGWTGFRFAVEELLWLSDSRAAAIVGARSRDDRGELLVVFDGRRLVTAPTAAYEDLATLRLSPSGGFVVAQIADPGGVLVVDRDGALVRPLVRHGSALAWSPDERWIAEATEDGVYVFPVDGGTPRVYVLPIVARDLVWR